VAIAIWRGRVLVTAREPGPALRNRGGRDSFHLDV